MLCFSIIEHSVLMVLLFYYKDIFRKGNDAKNPTIRSFSLLRWLEIVSSTYILMGRYNQSLSFDTTIMVSKNCPSIGEHVVTIFVTQ